MILAVIYESYTYAYKYDGNRYSEVGNGIITKAYTYDGIDQQIKDCQCILISE